MVLRAANPVADSPRSRFAVRPGDQPTQSAAPPRFRCGATRRVQWLVAASLAVCAILLGLYLFHMPSLLAPERELILAFSLIGLWRWGWAGLHYARAIIYR